MSLFRGVILPEIQRIKLHIVLLSLLCSAQVLVASLASSKGAQFIELICANNIDGGKCEDGGNLEAIKQYYAEHESSISLNAVPIDFMCRRDALQTACGNMYCSYLVVEFLCEKKVYPNEIQCDLLPGTLCLLNMRDTELTNQQFRSNIEKKIVALKRKAALASVLTSRALTSVEIEERKLKVDRDVFFKNLIMFKEHPLYPMYVGLLKGTTLEGALEHCCENFKGYIHRELLGLINENSIRGKTTTRKDGGNLKAIEEFVMQHSKDIDYTLSDDKHSMNGDKNTALQFACKSYVCSPQVVEFLCSKGAMSVVEDKGAFLATCCMDNIFSTEGATDTALSPYLLQKFEIIKNTAAQAGYKLSIETRIREKLQKRNDEKILPEEYLYKKLLEGTTMEWQ